MPVNKDRRLISGARVLCDCSLELPKLNPFSALKPFRKGAMVMNVRGASFYTVNQLSDTHAHKIFTHGENPMLKNVTFHPPNEPDIFMGDVSVRYLGLADGDHIVGLIVRFVNVSEVQMDMLNRLLTLRPPIEGREEVAILNRTPSLMPPMQPMRQMSDTLTLKY